MNFHVVYLHPTWNDSSSSLSEIKSVFTKPVFVCPTLRLLLFITELTFTYYNLTLKEYIITIFIFNHVHKHFRYTFIDSGKIYLYEFVKLYILK